MKRALIGLAALGLVVLGGCDDDEGGGAAPDGAVTTDGGGPTPDEGVGCQSDIDCLAAEYCDRPEADDADAEPPAGNCRPGCRIDIPNCPPGQGCNPDTRACQGECVCEPGTINGCERQALRVCADDCLRFRSEACPEGQRCMGGECVGMPPPEPDMAPPPEPDMAPPPEPDMAPPPEPDMAPPPEPDMAPPPEPDMGP